VPVTTPRLRVAVGVPEREVRARQAVLVRIVALEVERLGRDAERRLRGRRIRRRLGDRPRERQAALELGLDERIVVREHEPAAVAAFGQFGRPRKRPVGRVRVVVGLAVGHVEHVRREPRVEVGDRRPVEVA
jgi:hypothetical protein